MKTLIVMVFAVSLAGCAHLKKSGEAASVRSERDYAAGSEALAQDLYKTGQAATIEAARAQATAAANQEWARAAKATERKQSQEKLEKDLAKMDGGSK
jgi:hypothetical protein